MNRRDMLKKALQAGALLAIPGSIKPLLAGEKPFLYGSDPETALNTETSLTGNALRFPPVFTNGGTMTLAQNNIQVFPSMAMTQTISMNGSYPGPSVVIQKGQNLVVHFQNNLAEPATIHWHGIAVPELMDGHPKDAVAPGGNYTYTFPVNERAGTYFYHAHADMLTSKHVYKGFAGFFIVTDPAENVFNLPSGNYDVPLCIQDRRAADIPQFTYAPGTTEMMDGYLGDTVLVNGTPDAYFQVNTTKYRFRILNGSNARVYRIAFSDGLPFTIIGTDGGLKAAPANVNEFYLSPGERVDIVKDFLGYSVGQSVTLKSLGFTLLGIGPFKQGTPLDIMRFDITGTASSGGTVPAAFNPITPYLLSDVTTTRSFSLSMVSGPNHNHRINGLYFDMNRIDWQTPLYALEEWKIINGTNEYHPMHSHACQFQVYARNGNTNLPPTDSGWKDTVLLNPFETVRTLVKFNDYKGEYLYHCHNLEHEDDGMMSNFKIIDPIGIHQEGTEIPESFELHQNFPNPFNPSTKIKYDISKNTRVKMTIYNLQGAEIIALVNQQQSPGKYSVDWDASGLPSGTYFCKLETEGFVKTIKLALVK